jgi:hypothetical protein
MTDTGEAGQSSTTPWANPRQLPARRVRSTSFQGASIALLQNDARLSDGRRLWHGPPIDAANQSVGTNIVWMVPPAIPHVNDEIE